MLLSPEILAGETGGSSLNRGVTLRLEDVLLVVIGLSWFAKNAVMKGTGVVSKDASEPADSFLHADLRSVHQLRRHGRPGRVQYGRALRAEVLRDLHRSFS